MVIATAVVIAGPVALIPVATEAAAGAAAPGVMAAAAAAETVAAGAAAGAATTVAAAATTTEALVGACITTAASGAGATATGVATTAASGAIVGGASATPAAAGILASIGPVGWITLGADVTFDCWKAVLHDTSSEPSAGMLIKDVLADSRVQRFDFQAGVKDWSLHVWNTFGETFEIQPVMVGDIMYAHATSI